MLSFAQLSQALIAHLGEGVGDGLARSFGGDDKVIAVLLDLSDGLDVFGQLDNIFWEG